MALSADDVDRPLTTGTVVTSEACYGAQLYQPDAQTRTGMGNTYLRNGAILFFGSTVIAYGPSDYCDQADLITQYVYRETLNGRSSGYATLKARLDYVKNKTDLLPQDLKTLAEFTLLGDPSITPVLPSALAAEVDPSAAVAERRREARLTAHVLEQSISVPKAISNSELSSELEGRLRDIAQRHDLPPSFSIRSFASVWKRADAAPKDLGQPPRVHLLQAVRDPSAPVPTNVIITVREQEGTIVSVEEIEAR